MMAEDGVHHQFLFYTILTALFLALLFISQRVATYYSAYKSAPKEIQTFIDALDFSSQENGDYDHDVKKVQRMNGSVRLDRLLSDIKTCTAEFRNQINSLTRNSNNKVLQKHARIFWADKRGRLEESVRRLDLLRMRFLVVYMGIVANQAAAEEKPILALSPRPIPTPPTPPTPQQLLPSPPVTPRAPPLPKSITDAILKKPQLKKINTTPVANTGKEKPEQKMGWAGVIAELQKSPLMQKRHRSIETAMAEAKNAPTISPDSSPLSASL